MIDRLWAWMLASSPELATYVGEPGPPGSAPWTDHSPEACAERRATRRAFLDEVRAFGAGPAAGALDHQRAVTLRVAEAYLAAEVRIDAFPHEALLVDQ